MRKLLRAVGWILGVLVAAWLCVCAWLSYTHPRVTFTAPRSRRMLGDWLRGQVEAIRRARAEGVSVQGYFDWTLVGNFEWEKGYRPRFGLYRLDRRTLARTPTGGADVFTALAPR